MFSAIALILALFLLPFIFIVLAVSVSWPMLLSNIILSQVFIILFLKIVLAFRFKSRVLDSIFTPISIIYVFCIALFSAMQYKTKKSISWKDRNYNLLNIEEIKDIDDKTEYR